MKQSIQHADSTIATAIQHLEDLHKSLDDYHRRLNNLKIAFGLFIVGFVLFIVVAAAIFFDDRSDDRARAESAKENRIALCEQGNANNLDNIETIAFLRDVVIAQDPANEERAARIEQIFEQLRSKSLEENPLVDCQEWAENSG